VIKNIDVSKIHPHYNNPRKELGDLSELAESIRKTGILQNLTVVPWFSDITKSGADDPVKQEEMGYIAVIGHRRIAAAKLAGLKEVPCVISDMSYSEQIATMLLENMQRNDLTLYEQAEGFQMMLDLGESVGDISEKTGLSTTTVRRRVKLLDLDKEKFRQSVERGATLSDYIELEKIEDVDLKNSVLEAIGTANFKWKLQSAIDKEQANKNREVLIAELAKFAKPVDDTDGLQYIRGYYEYELRQKNFTVEKRDDAESVEYFYKVANGDVVLYTKQNDVSQNDEGLNTERAERARRNKALKAITKRAYQLRGNFVKEISNAVAKKKLTTIIEYNMAPMIWSFRSCSPDIEDYTDFIGENPIIKDAAKEDDIMAAFIKNKIAAEPEKSLLNVTWLMLDSEYENYYGWNERYRCNKQLDLVYEFLEKLGYEISEEELALKNGTHELFAPVGGKEK
jgi:ParB family chromosome partitioning protein